MKGWEERPLGDLHDPLTHRLANPERNLNHLIGQWDRRAQKAGWWDVAASLADAGPGNNPNLNRDIGMFDAGLHRLCEHFAGDAPERPLFLCISALVPHYPFVCPPDLFEYYRSLVALPEVDPEAVANLHPAYRAKARVQHPEPLSENHQLNAIAAYCGMVEVLDQQIGRALATLEELGVLDDFIVVHWSDHGDMMGEHGLWWKRTFHEASVRVPCLFHAPGRIRNGHEVHQNVSLVDLFPTLCELCDLEVPPGLDGRSIAGLLRGEDQAGWPDLVFSENWQPGKGSLGAEHVPAHMLKKGSWKLTTFGNHPHRLLHDLATDPGERHNRIDDPACARILSDLDEELRTLLPPRSMVPTPSDFIPQRGGRVDGSWGAGPGFL